MALVLLALILVPIAEIAVFIQVGGLIGLGPTLLCIVLSAVLGLWLLRRQGLKTVRDAQASLNRNEAPVRELIDGVCLFFAGAFLLTPGFITDAIGFLLMIPPVRHWAGAAAMRYFRTHGRMTIVTPGMTPGGTPGGPRRPGGRPDVIDGDYQEVDDSDGDLPPAKESRWRPDSHPQGRP